MFTAYKKTHGYQMSQLQPLKWHGGKSGMARFIHAIAPPSVVEDPKGGYTHRNIAFAGGLGELWGWSPIDGISETVNDLDSEIANFYSVLRSGSTFDAFTRLCHLSPFGDSTFIRGCDDRTASPPVWRAWGFFVRYRMSRQGLGKCYATPTARTRRGMNENVSAWLSVVDGLPEFHERLRRVEIRNMDGGTFVKGYDHERALFYLDPPYVHITRKTKKDYGQFEMSDFDHRRILETLSEIKGRFILSGYHSDLYDEFAEKHGWFATKIDRSLSSSSKEVKETKTEILWTNYRTPKLEIENGTRA